MSYSSRGFTLVELLVTIAITGMVFGIVISSSTNIKKASRDAQRQSDLKSIQGALERYKNDLGFYPAVVVGSLPVAGQFLFGSPLTNSGGTVTYLSNVANDPLGTAKNWVNYIYLPQGASGSCDNDITKNPVNYCSFYCLYAKVENPPNPDFTKPQACASFNISYDLVVTSP